MAEEQFSQTPEYQAQVLALMLHDPQFCTSAGDALSNEDFGDKALSWYYKKIGGAEIHLNPISLQEEIFRDVDAGTIRSEHVARFVEIYDSIKKAPVTEMQEHIKADMHKFVRFQAMKRAIMHSFDLMKEDKWDEIQNLVMEANQTGLDLMSIGVDYFAEYQDRLQNRMHRDEERKLPFGIPELDEVTYGGIKNKQAGIIVGGTGRGKSIFLEWMARVAVLLGKTVVLYTLELPEEDVADRFDSMFSKVKINELIGENKKVFESLSPMAEKFGKRLIIKEYPAGFATIDTFKIHVRQLNALGIQPDLILIDYLDLMKSHVHYGDKTQELEAIAIAIHGMAKAFNTRIFTATQLNRAGFHMETPDETAIAGALSKIFPLDIVLFLAQTSEERLLEEIRIIVNKSRNGPAGKSISVETSYSYMTFFKDHPQKTFRERKKEEEDTEDERPTRAGESAGAVFILPRTEGPTTEEG